MGTLFVSSRVTTNEFVLAASALVAPIDEKLIINATIMNFFNFNTPYKMNLTAFSYFPSVL